MTTATITIEGQTFHPLNQRVKVKIGNNWEGGALYELICKSVLPQYFALMDSTKAMRDLRNDVYASDDADA